jgi:hypothetical protein
MLMHGVAHGAFPGGDRMTADRVMWVLVVLVVLATMGRQVLINALPYDRAITSGMVAALNVLLLAAATGTLAYHTLRRRGLRRPALVLLAAALAHIVIWATGLPAALVNPNIALSGVAASTYFHLVTPLLVIVPLALSRVRRTHLLLLLVITGAVAFIWACAQAVVPAELVPRLLRPDGRTYVGMNALGVPRVNGLIGNPIEFGYFAVVMLSLNYAFRRRWRRRWPSTLIEALGLLVIVLASSRLFLLLAAVTTLAWRWRLAGNLGRIVFLGMVVAVSVYAVTPGSYVREMAFNWSTTASTQIHLDEMAIATTRFQVSPWLGYGVGSESFDGKTITDGYWFAASLERGIVGMASLLAWFVMPTLLAAWRLLSRTSSDADRDLMVCIVGCTAVVSSLVNSALYNHANALITFGLLGTAFAPISQRREAPDE